MTTSTSGPGRPSLSLAVLMTLVSSTWSDPEAIHFASGGLGELPSQLLSTKTVLGFLDFTTTVSDAVIKFTAHGGPGNTPAFSVQSALLESDNNPSSRGASSSLIEEKTAQ